MALKTYLTGIADAIREKKGTSDPINAQDFASEIASISTGGGDNLWATLINGRGANWDYIFAYNSTIVDATDWFAGVIAQPTSLAHAFENCQSLVQIPNIDISKVTNMNSIFRSCKSLTSIPQLDTSNVTDMGYMFYDCKNLISIPILNTNKVTKMNSMFAACDQLTSITQLDTSNVTDMYSMFNACAQLTTVRINTNKATGMSSIFAYCYKLATIDITKLPNTGATSFANNCWALTKLIIRTMDTLPTYSTNMLYNCYHMSGTVNGLQNPEGLQDGRIYVPDDKVDALKVATGWSAFADVIVPLSTLVED